MKPAIPRYLSDGIGLANYYLRREYLTRMETQEVGSPREVGMEPEYAKEELIRHVRRDSKYAPFLEGLPADDGIYTDLMESARKSAALSRNKLLQVGAAAVGAGAVAMVPLAVGGITGIGTAALLGVTSGAAVYSTYDWLVPELGDKRVAGRLGAEIIRRYEMSRPSAGMRN